MKRGGRREDRGPALHRALLASVEEAALSPLPLPERAAAALADLADNLAEDRIGDLPPGLLVQVRGFRDRPPEDPADAIRAVGCLADQVLWWESGAPGLGALAP